MHTGCAVSAIARQARSRTARARPDRGRRSSAPAPGRIGCAAPPGRPPSRGSSPSAAPTCACGPSAPIWSRANVYPVPDPELPFLGAHLTRGPDGDVLLGPSALMVGARDAYRLGRVRGADLRETLAWPGTWRLACAATGAPALTEIAHATSRRAFVGRRAAPGSRARARDFVAGPAGVRAQALARDGALVDDFLVSRAERALYVRNAPSPAATSSLPLARLIADEAEPLLG